MKLGSLRLRLTAALVVAVVGGALAAIAVIVWPLPQLRSWFLGLPASTGTPADAASDLTAWRGAGIAAIVALWIGFACWAAAALVAPLRSLARALEGSVLSYRDGDFNVSIASDRADELGDLVGAHQRLGEAVRAQRQQLAQRELMLDTVVQNTPVALLLVDAAGRIAYANLAARHLLGQGRSLDGASFAALLSGLPATLQRAVGDGQDTLFTLAPDDAGDVGDVDETFHLSQRAFMMQGRPHRLHLFRRITRELSRQEVATWKRVIRVISHELNNSLAPISSLAHSGAELLRRGDAERLHGVLATIGERARHLHGFLEGYASFAKLPAPRLERVEWPAFIDALALHHRFAVGALPDEPAWFDATQIEQALINLLTNAHEAGGAAADVHLQVGMTAHEWRVEVADRGPGMSEPVLAQALLPFYSTKRSGTGLGLALAREIAEAHGGRIALANREGGGMRVVIALPRRGDALNASAP